MADNAPPHRLIGISLLVVAAVALLVVNRFSGRDVPGQATGLPPIPPPAAGACLIRADVGAPVEVPCTDPHTAEVIQSWNISRRIGAESGCPPGGVTSGVFAFGDSWEPATPSMAISTIWFGGPIGWAACVRMPVMEKNQNTPLRYFGRLTEIGSDSERAAIVGRCFAGRITDEPGSDAYPNQVDCTDPHATQRLGIFLPTRRYDEPGQSCRQFAEQTIGPAAGGSDGLQIAEHTDRSKGSFDVSAEQQTIFAITCDVQTAPGRQLVGSVVGLGDGPIPFR